MKYSRTGFYIRCLLFAGLSHRDRWVMCLHCCSHNLSPYTHKFKVPCQGTVFIVFKIWRIWSILQSIMLLINSHPLQKWLSPEHWCYFLKYFLCRSQADTAKKSQVNVVVFERNSGLSSRICQPEATLSNDYRNQCKSTISLVVFSLPELQILVWSPVHTVPCFTTC